MGKGLDRRSRSSGGLRGRAAALAAVLAAVGSAPAWGQASSLEYAVKATYLYKFAPFIAWRAGAGAGPFQICVVGEDPFGPVLDRAVAGLPLGRRPVTVRRMAAAARGTGCHVLYIGGSSEQSAAEALREVKGEPVLTVTDAARKPDAKGVIHFWMAGGRVRFDIDPAAAAAQGLTVSSKLMALSAKARA